MFHVEGKRKSNLSVLVSLLASRKLVTGVLIVDAVAAVGSVQLFDVICSRFRQLRYFRYDAVGQYWGDGLSLRTKRSQHHDIARYRWCVVPWQTANAQGYGDDLLQLIS